MHVDHLPSSKAIIKFQSYPRLVTFVSLIRPFTSAQVRALGTVRQGKPHGLVPLGPPSPMPRKRRKGSCGVRSIFRLFWRYSRWCSNFLKLLLNCSKITQALPSADRGALLVECVGPHFGDFFLFTFTDYRHFLETDFYLPELIHFYSCRSGNFGDARSQSLRHNLLSKHWEIFLVEKWNEEIYHGDQFLKYHYQSLDVIRSSRRFETLVLRRVLKFHTWKIDDQKVPKFDLLCANGWFISFYSAFINQNGNQTKY